MLVERERTRAGRAPTRKGAVTCGSGQRTACSGRFARRRSRAEGLVKGQLDLDPRVQTRARAQTHLEHKHTHKHDKHGCTCVQRDEGKLVVRTSDAVLLRASGLRAGGCGRAKSGAGSVGGTKRESKRRADPRASMHAHARVRCAQQCRQKDWVLFGGVGVDGNGQILAQKRTKRHLCEQEASETDLRAMRSKSPTRAEQMCWVCVRAGAAVDFYLTHLISSHLISP
jgi:hypothetical protein